ncbi:peroxidase [Kitasatospora cheerisanensis KCTC 2395]|uniref:Peroxidase n=1 Tax=Kitasatospora cheerisanensis KCTC 2395 TaxID=1348663 RepID=A0A066Z737_9ACTN|nr:Dyp-type peroxidase [Kitasatospora cheerisanensis]KDN86131.1 peroxidase [Kitasatospora cheerisanensis KCTC 2395]
MPQPQPVLADLTGAAVFLVLALEEGGEQAVRDLLPDLGGLTRSVSSRAPHDGLALVVGIGSDAWDRLFAGPRPAQLHPFQELAGPRHLAPATPGDLLLHVRAERMDLCFELTTKITGRLGPAVSVVDETHGFRYFDCRDLIGFVDGTENPVGPEAAEAVLIGDEDPAFAGGSYVIVQKYLHDMDEWNALSTERQELVIGRTKIDNIELDDAAKPADSHVALNTVTGPDGEDRDIWRLNMPFGSFTEGGECGTYFIGYARDPWVTEEMLRNMFLGRGPAAHDRLLDFSTAVTGTFFHVPSADFLGDPPPAPGTAAARAGHDAASASQPPARPHPRRPGTAVSASAA